MGPETERPEGQVRNASAGAPAEGETRDTAEEAAPTEVASLLAAVKLQT